MAKTTALEAAYCATTYRVFLPEGPCDLRIGRPSATLRDWLATRGAPSWAIITAHNPGSVPCSPEANAHQQERLSAGLRAAGLAVWPALNIADDADWPAETACLAVGLALERACTFAGEYGQNAFVHGGADGIPHLVWLDESKQ